MVYVRRPRYQQQDAQELLRFLLDAIDTEESKRLRNIQKRQLRNQIAAAEEEAAAVTVVVPPAVPAAQPAAAIPPPPELIKNVSFFLGAGASERVEGVSVPQEDVEPHAPNHDAQEEEKEQALLARLPPLPPSVVGRLFGGHTVNVVVCDKCSTPSVTVRYVQEHAHAWPLPCVCCPFQPVVL